MNKRLLLLAVASVILSQSLAFAQDAKQQKSYGVDIKPEGSGTVTITVTVPVDDKRLKELGLDKAVTAADVRRMITTLGLVGAAHGGLAVGGVLSYTCESNTNKCICDTTDPLDCIDLISSGECSGSLGPPGAPDKICGIGDPCECKWH